MPVGCSAWAVSGEGVLCGSVWSGVPEAMAVSEAGYCSLPVSITHISQGKLPEEVKFGISQTPSPCFSTAGTRMDRTAGYLWDTGSCPEQPGQGHHHLPECCQPPLSQTQAAVTADQAGTDTANQNGARFIPNPQIPDQGTFPRGMHGFSIAENKQCFRGGRALVFGVGMLPVTQKWVSNRL